MMFLHRTWAPTPEPHMGHTPSQFERSRNAAIADNAAQQKGLYFPITLNLRQLPVKQDLDFWMFQQPLPDGAVAAQLSFPHQKIHSASDFRQVQGLLSRAVAAPHHIDV